jgi:hypothetical protein
MALSEHDQAVLMQMESALRAGTTRQSSNRTLGRHHHLAATIGLLTTGVLAIAVGLVRADGLGAGLGVLGFILIVCSAWSATRLLRPLLGSMSTRNPVVARKRR